MKLKQFFENEEINLDDIKTPWIREKIKEMVELAKTNPEPPKEDVKEKYKDFPKYTKKFMIADIRRQVLSDDKKALKAFETIDKIQERAGTASEDGKGFTRFDIDNFKNLFDKARNGNLSEKDKKQLREVMAKYSKQLWENAQKDKYQKVGGRWVVK